MNAIVGRFQKFGRIQSIFLLYFLFGGLFFPIDALAAVDLQTMLTTLQSQLPAVEKLFSAAAYLLGMGFVMAGVYHLKAYGDLKMMMPGNTNLYKPVASIVSGAMLLYLPTAYNVVLNTFFGNSTITPLDYSGGSDQWAQITALVVKIIQLIGVAAFIKGWVILAKGSQGGGQQSVMGKAFTHIIGGIMAINIVAVQNILFTSIGMSS